MTAVFADVDWNVPCAFLGLQHTLQVLAQRGLLSLPSLLQDLWLSWFLPRIWNQTVGFSTGCPSHKDCGWDHRHRP